MILPKLERSSLLPLEEKEVWVIQDLKVQQTERHENILKVWSVKSL